MKDLDYIFGLLKRQGSAAYGGESVTHLQHALQAATLAMHDDAGDALITAALFHDVGHLLRLDGAVATDANVAHEDIGAEYLADLFGPEVIEPIRLHVSAKRYLCAVEPAYFSDLSPATRQSLNGQGSRYSQIEADLFIKGQHAKAAVKLRRWDDQAMDPYMTTLTLSSFRPYAERIRL